MSKPTRPTAPPASTLRDPRSTGTPQTRFLSDIAGLKGTKRG